MGKIEKYIVGGIFIILFVIAMIMEVIKYCNGESDTTDLLITILFFPFLIGLTVFLMLRTKNKDKKNKVEENKSLPEEESNLSRKTINIINNGLDDEVELKIYEDNGDILRIKKEPLFTKKGDKFRYLNDTKDVFWGDSDDGPLEGNSLIINKNNLLIEKDVFGDQMYYIDINNIIKITRENGHLDLGDDYLNAPTAKFVIYTKDHHSIELLYNKDVKKENGPLIIKETNNSIIFEYTYNMDDEYYGSSYTIKDKLLIGEPTSFKYNNRYDIVLEYSDIISVEIINSVNDRQAVKIAAKDNFNYIIEFLDKNMVTKFFNELKEKIK